MLLIKDEMAEKKMETNPNVFVTDELQAYRDAFKKEYDYFI